MSSVHGAGAGANEDYSKAVEEMMKRIHNGTALKKTNRLTHDHRSVRITLMMIGYLCYN